MRKPYLAIDTSTALGSVAVGRADALLAEVVVGVSTRHSESLLPAIDFALRSAGLEPRALGGVVVAGGPGSFTGVRVAAATAKGFVRALGVPLFAYSGLLALAAAAGAGETAVCALFDARRGEVYAGCWRFPGDGAVEVVMPPRAAPVEQVVRELAAAAPRYVGEGALRYRARIEAAGGRVAPGHQAAPRAGALLWLADVAPGAGTVADPRSWEPEYIRAAGAERGVRG
ncbi:MAG TPA: tRNA (adenosine(37)-N6)-threonylcarbamoyltransferase complex dimerization subunit type 1 TsaB [Longimicrobiales bacterium]